MREINERINGLSVVRRLDFKVEPHTGVCELEILLAAPAKTVPSSECLLKAVGVSNLSVRDFGGGLTQVMGLRVEDIDHLQHDRIRYAVSDVEDGSAAFRCQDLKVASL